MSLNDVLKKGLGLVIGVTFIATPIGLYIDKFGFGYWGEHQKWAEFGSYIGGVVTPILTLITIVFLLLQLKYLAEGLESERKHRLQTETNAEIDYFTNLIAVRVADVKTTQSKSFSFEYTTQELDEFQLELIQLWNCIYIALMPFLDKRAFENQHDKAIIKIKAVVGHRDAHYLDYLLRVKETIPQSSCYFS